MNNTTSTFFVERVHKKNMSFWRHQTDPDPTRLRISLFNVIEIAVVGSVDVDIKELLHVVNVKGRRGRGP